MFEMNYLHMIRLQIVEDLQEEIEIGNENEEVGPNCNGNYKKTSASPILTKNLTHKTVSLLSFR